MNFYVLYDERKPNKFIYKGTREDCINYFDLNYDKDNEAYKFIFVRRERQLDIHTDNTHLLYNIALPLEKALEEGVFNGKDCEVLKNMQKELSLLQKIQDREQERELNKLLDEARALKRKLD